MSHLSNMYGCHPLILNNYYLGRYFKGLFHQR